MSNNRIWNYSTLQDGVVERSIKIKAKKTGKALRIAHLTDLHLNFCNQRDIAENDPVLMSTLENREWLKDGSSLDNAKRTLAHARDADAIVITGDILDYLSYGTEELATEHIFSPYPHLIASLGNHESARKVQGKLPENMPYEDKERRLAAFWPNDLNYSSHIIDNRVMLIQIDDSSKQIGFNAEQVARLSADIEYARENNCIALLFFHIHISPYDESYSSANADKIGDKAWAAVDLNRHGIRVAHGEQSAKMIDLIKSSADVIKGCFCGHMHSDFYCEIGASDGQIIPQYILIGASYDNGHLLNIIIE